LKIERKEQRRNRRLARNGSGLAVNMLDGNQSRNSIFNENILLTELADASRLGMRKIQHNESDDI